MNTITSQTTAGWRSQNGRKHQCVSAFNPVIIIIYWQALRSQFDWVLYIVTDERKQLFGLLSNK